MHAPCPETIPRPRWHLVAGRALVLICLAAPMAVLHAAGGGGGGGGGGGDIEPAQASREYRRALAAIDAGRWNDAIALLEVHVKRQSDDADGHNWLAYAYRKSGQLEPAFAHYRRALVLVPGHLGAHEYIGEAYLQAGQPEKAEAHLKELARLCASNCEQYFDLRKAIAQYRAGTPTAKAPGG